MYATKYTLTRRSPETTRAQVAALADYPRLATCQIEPRADKPADATTAQPARQPVHRRRGPLHPSTRVR